MFALTTMLDGLTNVSLTPASYFNVQSFLKINLKLGLKPICPSEVLKGALHAPANPTVLYICPVKYPVGATMLSIFVVPPVVLLAPLSQHIFIKISLSPSHIK